MARRILGVTIGALALALMATAQSAAADGTPVPEWIPPHGGVPGPSGTHYAVDADYEHGRTNVTERSASGRVLQSRTIRGTFIAPAIGFDGSPSQLSGDGGTLALIKARQGFPQSRTRLLLLDTNGLSVREPITLHRDFRAARFVPLPPGYTGTRADLRN
jgi:hypothetical protein